MSVAGRALRRSKKNNGSRILIERSAAGATCAYLVKILIGGSL